ncbi:MAG TPA: hypothetical protein VNK96_04235 [Fimbriimonadales bacterium]|nr:hypothetical protein [Fimbriimonadales bacterium]
MGGFTQFLAQKTPPETSFWVIERTAGPIWTQKAFWWVLGTIIVTSIILFFVARVPSNLRKWVVVAITFACGMFYVLEWLIPKTKTPAGEVIAPVFGFNWLDGIPVASSTAQIVAAFLLVLGVISIFRVHFGRLFKLQRDWPFSAVLLISMAVIIFLGYSHYYTNEKVVESENYVIDKAARDNTLTPRIVELARLGVNGQAHNARKAKLEQIKTKLLSGRISAEEAEAARALAQSEYDEFIRTENEKIDAAVAQNTLTPEVAAHAKAGISTERDRTTIAQGYRLVFTDMLVVLDAAMFSLIAFFILSAAYRAFRIRSIEATILMLVALVILLSFVPLGLALTNWLDPKGFEGNFRIDTISDWILATLNTPAIRAINLGLGLGVVAMATRIMLGLEKGVSD